MNEATDRLDPWVERWMAENPVFTVAPDEFSDEMLGFARADVVLVRGPEVARVSDEVVAGMPIRIYEPDEAATGVVVYFHGGGFCTGSLGFCDNVARELAGRGWRRRVVGGLPAGAGGPLSRRARRLRGRHRVGAGERGPLRRRCRGRRRGRRKRRRDARRRRVPAAP